MGEIIFNFFKKSLMEGRELSIITTDLLATILLATILL